MLYNAPLIRDSEASGNEGLVAALVQIKSVVSVQVPPETAGGVNLNIVP